MMKAVPCCSFRHCLAVLIVGVTAAVWAKEVTLTVNTDADIATQLSTEGKTLADGDTLVKLGSAVLTMDDTYGALLSGGTVKAGTLAVNPANGLGKAGADWTVGERATIRIGGTASYKTGIKFRMSGTGVDDAGALAVYNSNYETSSDCDFYLNADATMNIFVGGSSYSGLFSKGRLHFDGHALTLKGAVANAQIRQRLGGQVYGGGTLVLDGVQYTSGGVADANYSYDAGKRSMRLKNGSSYRVNIQKQFDAYETYDGEKGTTLRTDSGNLATATFKNLTGSPTLDASLQAVTVAGVLTARGTDLASGTCLDCQQAVALGTAAAFDLVDDETVESGREYAVATATGGFSGSLPRAVGRAYRRQAVLRFSEDGKTLFATFGEPVTRDFGAVSAWYRFDDLQIGSAQGNGAAIVNEVDPLLGLGKVQLLDRTAASVSTGLAPVAAQPSELTEVYDPLTGVTFSNRASLDFRTETYSGTSTKGSAVAIAGDGSNVRPDSVTIEAFVCTTGGSINVMAPIVSLTGGGSQVDESLALQVNSSGFICARYCGKGMSVANIVGHTRTTGTQLFDGCWHHVALVYSKETGKVTGYVDYRADGIEVSVGTDGLRFSDDTSANAVYVGGYTVVDGRKFNGRIDEVRITGAALAPESFLRRRRPAAALQGLVDEQTLFFSPMSAGETGEAVRDDVNWSANTPAAYVRKPDGGVAAFDADSPAPGVRGSHRRMASTAAGSLPVGGASDATGAFIVQNGDYRDWFGDDLTIEGSFKTSDGRSEQTVIGFGTTSNYALKLMVHASGKFYLAGFAPDWWDRVVTRSSVADGAWHRFTVVFDKAAGTISAEIDGEHALVTGIGTIANARLTVGASRNANGVISQSFTGRIGPVRITRGKLKPCAWMGAVDPAEADPTMRDGVAFHLRGLMAEGLLDVQPYPSSRTPGETALLSVAGAVAPSFTSTVRWPRCFLYGEEDGLVATNTGSIHLQNSALVFRGDRALDCGSQTVECLAKFTSIGSAAHLFRLGMTEGEKAEQAANRVIAYFARGSLVVSLSVDEDGQAGYCDHTTPIGASELTGGWHHLAISWDEDAADGTTTVRVYLDYRLRCEFVTDRRIWHPAQLTRYSLAIGYPNPITNEGLVGDIDEFRITEGVLQPENFIRKVPSHLGFLLIAR